MNNRTSVLWGLVVITMLFTLSSSNTQTTLADRQGKPANEWLVARALNHVQATSSGFTVHHPSYEVNFSKKSLKFEPVSGAPLWHWSNKEDQSVFPQYGDDRIFYNKPFYREEYLLKANTIEQLFVLTEPLPHDMDALVIEGSITTSGEFEIFSGKATWKNAVGEVTLSDVFAFDATGKAVPVCMEVFHDGTRIELQAADLAEAAYPVTIDPEIGTNDYRISTFGTDGDNSTNANDAAITYSSTSNKYLVVWEGSVAGEFEIYAQLLNGTTGLPEGGIITVSSVGPPGDANYDATDPDVATNGDEFLVVYRADDNTAPLVDNEFEIYAQRLNSNSGTLIGSRIRLSDMGPDGNATYSAFSPAIVYNSTASEYAVAWHGDDNSGSLVDEEFEIYFQRLSSTGDPSAFANDVRISDMGSDGSSTFQAFVPDIAWNSTSNQYMVVWYGDDAITPLVDNEFEIFMQRLFSTGAETGSNDIRISDMGPNGNTAYNVANPAITYNGVDNNFLVVWHAEDDVGGVVDGENEIYVQVISNSGTEVGTDLRISDMGPDGNINYDAFNPSVSHDPFLNQFLVTWQGDDNTAPLILDEVEIFGQLVSGTGSEVGTDFRLSDAGGSGNVTYNANRPHQVFNSTMREHLIVYDADENIGSLIDNEFEIWGQRFAEMSNEPTAQPTAPVFSAITSSSFDISFSAASGSPDGYIVLRKAGSSPTDVPTDQQVYTVGNTIGSSTVVHVGSALSFSQTGLNPNTQYFYDFFSYNGVNSSTNYRTASPQEGSATTLFAEPTTQGTLAITSFATNSITVNLGSGNGSNRLLVAKAGSAVDVFPVDGTSYTPNNNITLAPNLGASNFVVGSGTGSVTVSGLSLATVYHFRVFEFNGTGTLTNYNTTSVAGSTGSQTTLSAEPTAQPTAINFSAVTNTSFTVGYTAASGSPTGYIAVRKAGAAPAQPADLPVDGTAYAANDIIGGSTVAYVGPSLSFAQSTLTPATQYFYVILSYNGTGGNINYLTSSPLAGNQFTLANEPTTQANNITFSSLSPTSLTVSWTNGNGSERLVLARQGSAVSVNPADGTGYSGNADFGLANDLGSGNKVVYRGAGNSVNITNLTANTVYHFRVYELNGSSASANYLTSTATGNPGSRTTLMSEPTVQSSAISFSSITPNSITVNYTNGNGASRLLIARQGSAVNTDPVDGSIYTANAVFGTPASELGTGNYIVGAGSGPVTVTGLTSGATYHFRVYEFNGSASAENYLVTTASGNPANASTLIGEPTVQASTITFTAFTDNSLSISWTNGNGAERLVLAKQGSAVNVDPADGSSYTGNSNFASATDVGSGNKVVFRGSGSSVTVTNLSANTVYHFRIYELNGSGVSTNYLLSTATGNPANRTTLINEPSAQPSSLSFSLQTTTTLRLNYTAAAGSPTGYLIIRKTGSASAGVPVDGTFYSVGNSLDGTIVAIGNFTQFDDTGLSAGTVYHYTVFSYNGAGQAVNYLTGSPLTGSTITLPVAPTAQVATGVQQFQFTANWTSITGASDYRLDVSPDNFSTFVSGYNSKTVNGTSDVVTGLNAGVTYQYRVRASNASGQSANSGNISQITVPPTPAGVNTTGAEQTQFTISWTASVGAVDYLLDVSDDNFATFVTGYNGKVITGTSETVSAGLMAGTTYQVRVRSRNAGGTSPNSLVVTQLLKPATPVALDANPIGINSFTAKWESANGAGSYILDASTQNDFSTHLSGYPNNEGNALEKLITGLTANSSYYYRVKAVNATGESPYSNIKPVQTQPDPGGQNMVIGVPVYTDLASGQTAVAISVTVTGGTGSKTVELLHKKISSTGTATSLLPASVSGNTFMFDLPATAFDEIGAEFFIRASDATAVPPVENSLVRYVYKSFTDQTAPVISSIVRHGGTQKSYQIISIPFKLTKNSIADIFEPVPELGAYDKTIWRLVRYQNNKNTDYEAGINTIDQGKSYWFNSVDEVTIKSGAGTTPNNNQAAPFSMSLAQGWNQIATPYPFAIDWDDVLEANGNPDVGPYKIFNSNQLSFAPSNSMNPFEGGFVFADNAVPSLIFPVTLKNTAGGRIKHDEDLSADIDATAWTVSFEVVQHEVVSQGGFGMHPMASLSKDRFDDVTVPRFVQYLEGNFYHPEFFWPRFSRDVVPATAEHTWELTIESNGSGPIELKWNTSILAMAQSGLYLVDELEARMVDMRVQTSVTFNGQERRNIKIFYSRNGEYQPSVTRLGKAWPNPTTMSVNIPIVLSGITGHTIEVDVFDIRGTRLTSLQPDSREDGFQTLQWNGQDQSGNAVANGLYIIKLKVNGRYLPEVEKVVVHRNR